MSVTNIAPSAAEVLTAAIGRMVNEAIGAAVAAPVVPPTPAPVVQAVAAEVTAAKTRRQVRKAQTPKAPAPKAQTPIRTAHAASANDRQTAATMADLIADGTLVFDKKSKNGNAVYVADLSADANGYGKWYFVSVVEYHPTPTERQRRNGMTKADVIASHLDKRYNATH